MRRPLADYEPVARTAIDDLVESYVAGVDGGALEELAELFAPEAVLVVHGGAEFHGREEILGFVTRSRETRKFSPVGRIRHHTVRGQVRFDTATSAKGTAYFACTSEVALDHWGIYEDQFTAIDGVWYFERRSITIEGADPGGWIGSGVAPVKFERG